MTTIRTLFSSLLLILCLTPIIQPAELDRSGVPISLQSNVYQIGNKWYCPLCRQEVANGDRSGWDLKLCLSEWHDVLIDKDYFHDKIRYISDEELVNSLHIKAIEPALQKALKARDYDRISVILHDYFSTRPDNQRLSTHDFVTIDAFRQKLVADSLQYAGIVRSFNDLYTPEKGFTLHGVHWGKRINFNHTYPHTSKWGVHYLSFVSQLINYYLLKQDPEIAKVFDDVFTQWYDQLDSVKHEQVINIGTSYDFIWYELGLANRTQLLIDAQRAFVKQISPETNKRLLKNMLGSARWLDQCLLKTPFHSYNWQTHTSLTLSYAAVVFPEFRESQMWLNRGRQNMVLHLENDIRDDGGYVERTTSYAAYMFSVYNRYLLMFQYFNNDLSLRNKYMHRLEKFIEFFVLTNTPIGVNAPFNDAIRSKSLVSVFREMGEFFKRGDFIGAVQYEFSPEALAAMPIKVIEPKTKTIDFPDSRFVVMRDSWHPKSYFMILNYGEFQNHSHYDHLAFEIYANGLPIALDAALGELGYLDSLVVTWYKHPRSHNMLTINQAVPEKLDMPGYDKIWSPQQYTGYFAATHDGYVRYQQARHRRHIIFSKTRYWLIVDEVNTAGKDQEMDFNFHTPCAMSEIEDGFISNQDNGFLIKQDHLDAPHITKIKSQGGADLGGLPNEPAHRDIDWLVFRKLLRGARQSDRMATLIYPFASKERLIPAEFSVEKLELKDTVAIGYKVKTGNQTDIVILSDGKYRKFTDLIEGDFKYGLIRVTAGGVDYAGFSSVGKFKLAGVVSESFKTKKDYEYKN
ncbi:heparinase II/III family protein [candidate division KSB1 bacterium]|nr:heparinase II/III family protein [candidate division KSB1 bacterium]